MERNSTESGKLVIGLGYNYEYLSKAMVGTEEWININNERTNNTTYSIFLNYSVTDNFSLEAVIPFRLVTNEKILFRGQYDKQPEGGKYIRDTDGLADIVVMGRYGFYPFDNNLQMAFGLGVKLATGDTEAQDIYGKRFSDNLQIGSGTIDPIISFFMAYPNGNWLSSLSALTRLSLHENIYGYKYGNEYHLSLGMNYSLSEIYFIKNRINYIFTQRDTYQFGYIVQSRGGETVYMSPGIGIRINPEIKFNVDYSIALYQRVNEAQLMSDGFITFNLNYSF